MKRILHTLWLPGLLLLLMLPAVQPLWQPGLQQTDDGLHHLSRLFGLDEAVRAGHLGARWLAHEGFGYGFPVLNFYAPLTYFAGLLLHWLGLGLVTSLEWSLALGLLLSGLTMFLFAGRLLGRWGGALAALAYVWAPYHLADAWTRGALAELWALIWLPLLLLALGEIARHSGRAGLGPVLGGSAALAALVLTHNLSVILAAPLLAAWGIVSLAAQGRGGRAFAEGLGSFGLVVLLGLLGSAAFWLPALGESATIWAGQVALDFDQWQQQLTVPGRLLAQGWVQRYDVIEAVGTLHPLGQAQLLLALTGAGVGLWGWRRWPAPARWGLPLWLGLALAALFMQTTWAAQIWQRTPGLLLLQFPWRWQAVSAVSLALLSGYALAGLTQIVPPARRLWMALAGLIGAGLLLMSSGLPGLAWRVAAHPTTDAPVTDATLDRATLAMYDFGRGLWLREHGGEWMFEYMPVWVEAPRSEFFLSAGPGGAPTDPLAVNLIPGRQRPLERRFSVAGDAAWTLQLHQFYFPGWQAQVDGRTLPAAPTGPLALAGVDLPAGEHAVIFRFGSTPVRRLGWALTGAGLALWLAGALWLRRWGWLAALAVAVLLSGSLAGIQAQRHPADYTPVAVTANLGNQIQLTGFHAPPAQLAPDAPSEVILLWLALDRPATDYKVFVHLIDLEGRLWAQHDGEPGFFFSPTTRWQRGEIVEDRHMLSWTGEAPPGRYQLRAGLYDPATGQRLPVLGPDGDPVDDQILLAEFDLP